jgi:hypothetical protein
MRSLKIPRTTDLTERDPPDIALIMLPDARWSDIAARKSFYNISKRQRELLAYHPEQRSGFWTISGFAQEWVSTDLRDNGSKRVIELNGMVLTGSVTPIQTKAEFDGWAFTAQDGGQYDGPKNFGGYSGGGLWQNLIKEEDGQIRLVESTLLGVAYHQSGFERNLNAIRCNGRRCIYEHIVQVAKAAR